MAKEEVSIQSIKIMMGKKEVELTIDEAKKLKAALSEIFGKEVVNKTEHVHHWDYYYTPRPYYWGQIYYGGAGLQGQANGGTYQNMAVGGSNMSQLCVDIK